MGFEKLRNLALSAGLLGALGGTAEAKDKHSTKSGKESHAELKVDHLGEQANQMRDKIFLDVFNAVKFKSPESKKNMEEALRKQLKSMPDKDFLNPELVKKIKEYAISTFLKGGKDYAILAQDEEEDEIARIQREIQEDAGKPGSYTKIRTEHSNGNGETKIFDNK